VGNNLDVEKVEKQVKEWCTDEGIFKIKRPSDSKAEFIFDLTYPFNHPHPMHFLAVMPKEKDHITIACGTQISPPHLQCLKSQKRPSAFSKASRKRCWSSKCYIQLNRKTMSRPFGSYPTRFTWMD
jgi:hypothetical protein